MLRKRLRLKLLKPKRIALLNNFTNQVILGGVVSREPTTKRTPAGIPITRFTLAHHSTQTEVEMDRKVDLKIGVIATGDKLLTQLKDITAGSAVSVKGFLNKSVFRGQEIKLVLHAESITKE